jgi:hypothetical protein
MLEQIVSRTIVMLEQIVSRTIVMLDRTVSRTIVMLDQCNKASVSWFKTVFTIIRLKLIGQCLQILSISCKIFILRHK